MANKTLKTRIINKHDTQANWAKAVNFIPKAGEVIVYTDLHKVKVGDGTTKVSALPFIDDKDLSNYVTEIDLGTIEGDSGTLSPTILSEINNAISDNKQFVIKANFGYDIILPNIMNIAGASLRATGIVSSPGEATVIGIIIDLSSGQYMVGNFEIQEKLVSGTNIKTVNEQSLVGTGNIAVQEPLVSGTNIKTVNGQTLLGSGNISSVGSISQDSSDGHKLIVTSNGTPSTIIIPDNDTHYTTKLVVTNPTGTANASTTNGNTKLRLFDNDTARNTIGITGTGGTTVSSDASGNITINSTALSNYLTYEDLGTI